MRVGSIRNSPPAVFKLAGARGLYSLRGAVNDAVGRRVRAAVRTFRDDANILALMIESQLKILREGPLGGEYRRAVIATYSKAKDATVFCIALSTDFAISVI